MHKKINSRLIFRVWSKRDKKYIKKSQYFYLNEKGYIVCCMALDSYIFEQCIGKKDKNNRLIYDNDIILVNGERILVKYLPDLGRYNIDFSKIDWKNCEIIGNGNEYKERS